MVYLNFLIFNFITIFFFYFFFTLSFFSLNLIFHSYLFSPLPISSIIRLVDFVFPVSITSLFGSILYFGFTMSHVSLNPCCIFL